MRLHTSGIFGAIAKFYVPVTLVKSEHNVDAHAAQTGDRLRARVWIRLRLRARYASACTERSLVVACVVCTHVRSSRRLGAPRDRHERLVRGLSRRGGAGPRGMWLVRVDSVACSCEYYFVLQNNKLE